MKPTALQDAIERSAFADAPGQTVLSPLTGLRRRQLTQFDLIAQAMSTMAPATGIVYIAKWMTGRGLADLLAIVVATLLVVVVALCIRQFTIRLSASGSLYSFIAQGMRLPVALVAGVTLLVGYLVMAASMLEFSTRETVDLVCSTLGIGAPQHIWVVVLPLVALCVGLVVIRGVRWATRLILIIEVATITMLSILLLWSPVGAHHALSTDPHLHLSFAIFIAIEVVISLAGFESAAFFDMEAERPLRTVSRAVVAAPIITGCLFVLAGWAGMTGRATAVVDAFFNGPQSEVAMIVVIAVNFGMCSSGIACALGFTQAGSRLLFSLGVENVVPKWLARIHPRFATPHLAVLTFVLASIPVAIGYEFATATDALNATLDISWLLIYILAAAASVAFLRRIGEETLRTTAAGVLVAAGGSALLAYTVADSLQRGSWLFLLALIALCAVGLIWYELLRRRNPDSLQRVGVFDSVETADLLPGSARLHSDSLGRPVLTSDPGAAPR